MLLTMFAFPLLCSQPAAAEVVIKIATVAPRGSVWMRYFDKMKSKVEKETNKAVRLKFYPGQVQGDERDVVRKMRTGQLQGGSFTTVGLAMINPEALVLQLPLMFRNYARLDKVKVAMKADFERSFEKRGYVLLGWSELGMIHLFTKNKVASLAELRKQRVWAWNDDPISKAMMRALNVKPRVLGLPQVYPALTTGMVDVVTNSPLGAMALQWHTKINYMIEMPLAIGIGATVITKKVFDKLTPAQQQTLKKWAAKVHTVLTKRIRKDNDKARAALKAQGMIFIKMKAADHQAYRAAATKVARSFVPRYYSAATLNKVRRLQ